MNWIASPFNIENIEYILSIDEHDPELMEYFKCFNHFTEELNIQVIVNNNKSVVDATNAAAKIAKGDILVYVSDDFDCPASYDVALMNAFTNKISMHEPALLKVDDCLQKFDVPVLTIPIMNRCLYEKLGYFWHPEYKSMFVDEDLYWTCFNNNWLYLAPDLKFEHQHCSVGKSERDNTYIRSESNWDQGKELFAKRKALNFPLS